MTDPRDAAVLSNYPFMSQLIRYLRYFTLGTLPSDDEVIIPPTNHQSDCSVYNLQLPFETKVGKVDAGRVETW